MMKVIAADATNTLAILLGASDWPGTSLSRSSFQTAHDFFLDYLTHSNGLALIPGHTLLKLFGSTDPASSVIDTIGNWLGARCSDASQYIYLIVYYVGHGSLDKDDLCLLLGASRPSNPATCLGVKSLAYTLHQNARRLRQIVIIDACHAGASNGSWWKSPEGVGLLCSSNQTDLSIAPLDAESTSYSEALRLVLRPQVTTIYGQGENLVQIRLTAQQLHDSIKAEIRASPRIRRADPALHAPVQRDRSPLHIPIFPVIPAECSASARRRRDAIQFTDLDEKTICELQYGSESTGYVRSLIGIHGPDAVLDLLDQILVEKAYDPTLQARLCYFISLVNTNRALRLLSTIANEKHRHPLVRSAAQRLNDAPESVHEGPCSIT